MKRGNGQLRGVQFKCIHSTQLHTIPWFPARLHKVAQGGTTWTAISVSEHAVSLFHQIRGCPIFSFRAFKKSTPTKLGRRQVKSGRPPFNPSNHIKTHQNISKPRFCHGIPAGSRLIHVDPISSERRRRSNALVDP